jgi:subtilase family serine protease
VASNATFVGIYNNRDAVPSPGEKPDYQIPVPQLAPGHCATSTGQQALKPGAYQAWAYVDIGQMVQEANEENNSYGPVPFSSGTIPADLVVVKLEVKPSTTPGYVTFQATVCNQGQGKSTPAYLEIYYHRTSAPQPQNNGNKNVYVSALAPGACTLRQTSAYLGAGTYQSWAYVDRQNAVPESDEGNNVFGPYAWTQTMPDSDLTIDSFSATADTSGFVSYTVKICNLGGLATPATYVFLYHNRATKPSSNSQPSQVLSLGALPGKGADGGVSCSELSASAALGPGSYYSWAYVDPKNAVPETNESNNIAGPKSFTIGSDKSKSCDLICNTMISPCNMLPSNQKSSCLATCQAQSDATIDCGLKEATAGNCVGILTCLFGP